MIQGGHSDRARWLVRLRWIVLAVAAAAIALASPLAGDALEFTTALGLAAILGVYAAANALLDALLGTRARDRERALFVTVLADSALITVALHMTGGIENPFHIAYAFPVIAAGIALPRSQSYAVAACSCLLFVALGLLEYAKTIPHHDVYLLPFWRPTIHLPVDLYEDRRYIAGTSTVLIVMLGGISYLTTSIATQLRRNEDRLEGILHALGEGVAYFDGDDRLVLANDAFRAMIPGPLSTRLLELAPPGVRGPLEEALLSVRSGEPFESFEAVDGPRRFACGLSGVRGSGGLAWVLEDVTARRRDEERATLDKRLADLGVLAAGIAHEVLNPLASISSTAQLIESEPGELVRDRVARIRKQVDRITRIVRGVAELARPTTKRPAPAPLDEILADAVSLAREERPDSAEVALEVEQPVPRAIAAEEPLRVAVKNLVTNALDAAGKAGHVTVRARRDGDDALVEVEDDGPGVTDAENIFVPFFTTKSPGAGAGLGLPIAASIVRQHGGKIEVASTPGHGARFTMRLPGRAR